MKKISIFIIAFSIAIAFGNQSIAKTNSNIEVDQISVPSLTIVNPQIIVLLGGVAISSMIGPWKVSEAHGHFYEANNRTFFMTKHIKRYRDLYSNHIVNSTILNFSIIITQSLLLIMSSLI